METKEKVAEKTQETTKTVSTEAKKLESLKVSESNGPENAKDNSKDSSGEVSKSVTNKEAGTGDSTKSSEKIVEKTGNTKTDGEKNQDNTVANQTSTDVASNASKQLDKKDDKVSESEEKISKTADAKNEQKSSTKNDDADQKSKDDDNLIETAAHDCSDLINDELNLIDSENLEKDLTTDTKTDAKDLEGNENKSNSEIADTTEGKDKTDSAKVNGEEKGDTKSSKPGPDVKVLKTNSSQDERSLWISNINPKTTANTLKSELSKYGKVITAKIVTNGENYYGYATMVDKSLVSKCLEKLNHTKIDGYEVTCSRELTKRKKVSDSSKSSKTKVFEGAKDDKKKDTKDAKNTDSKDTETDKNKTENETADGAKDTDDKTKSGEKKAVSVKSRLGKRVEKKRGRSKSPATKNKRRDVSIRADRPSRKRVIENVADSRVKRQRTRSASRRRYEELRAREEMQMKLREKENMERELEIQRRKLELERREFRKKVELEREIEAQRRKLQMEKRDFEREKERFARQQKQTQLENRKKEEYERKKLAEMQRRDEFRSSSNNFNSKMSYTDAERSIRRSPGRHLSPRSRHMRRSSISPKSRRPDERSVNDEHRRRGSSPWRQNKIPERKPDSPTRSGRDAYVSVRDKLAPPPPPKLSHKDFDRGKDEWKKSTPYQSSNFKSGYYANSNEFSLKRPETSSQDRYKHASNDEHYSRHLDFNNPERGRDVYSSNKYSNDNDRIMKSDSFHSQNQSKYPPHPGTPSFRSLNTSSNNFADSNSTRYYGGSQGGVSYGSSGMDASGRGYMQSSVTAPPGTYPPTKTDSMSWNARPPVYGGNFNGPARNSGLPMSDRYGGDKKSDYSMSGRKY